MIVCGTGRRSINPEPGHALAGYGAGYPNEGVHDDLTLTVLFLADGATRAALACFDLIGMDATLNLAVRAAIGEALDLPSAQVVVTCTHTHGGPEVRDYHPTSGTCDRARPAYNALLIARAREAAREAGEGAEPCELLWNRASAAHNMNRRFVFPDRTFHYVPDRKQLAGLSDEHVDRELGLIAFRRAGSSNRYRALLTNYAMHPVCVGNASNLCTADWPGALRAVVEDTFAGCRCVATTGAMGDQHPLLPEAGFASARRVGGALGELAVARAYDAVRVDDQALRLVRRQIELPLRDAATRRLFPREAERAYVPDLAAGGAATVRVEIALLGIGPVLLVGVPGELVAELGSFIKWCSPFLATYVLYQATGNLGYIPAGNQHLWGGYEAVANPFARRAGELLVRAVLDAADELAAQRPLALPPIA
ncbi:MAG TPA: hypothetical protein VEL07_17865 [Planctomycetota bacterium]|nr:hypothetical protein [Planctomycetota bacterium]